MESRTQSSRPRTQKNFEAKVKDRPTRGQGPRTQKQVFSKKKVLKIFFRRSQKKDLQKIFFRRYLLEETKKRSLQIFRKVSGVFQRSFNSSKIVLFSSRGQGNFRGLEASRPRTSKCVLEAKDVFEDSISDANHMVTLLFVLQTIKKYVIKMPTQFVMPLLWYFG